MAEKKNIQPAVRNLAAGDVFSEKVKLETMLIK